MRNRLNTLKAELSTCNELARIDEIRTEIRYILTKNCGKVADFRSQEITKRVVKDYPLDKQIGIILDGNADEIASLKAFRAQKAIEVDEMISKYEEGLANEDNLIQ